MADPTVTDVRIALNNISDSELSSTTIQQKLDDATDLADVNSIPAGRRRERFIRDWAAWQSFIVSKTFSSVRIGDVSVRRDLEKLVETLRQNAITALQEATETYIVVEATPMFDDRPRDEGDPSDIGGVVW